MILYRLTLNGQHLIAGRFSDCWRYLGIHFGGGNMQMAIDQGYRIAPSRGRK